MIPTVNKWQSISLLLIKLIILSALATGIFFLAGNFLCSRVIEKFYYDSDYSKKKDEEYVKKLQDYIISQNLRSRDFEKLGEWVKKQKILSIRVFKENREIFDSEYPDENIWEEEIENNEYEWETYYSIEFNDGIARVGIIGKYEYQLFNYSLIMEIVLSFALFILIILLGIRKKMRNISELYNEIMLMEGGNLDHNIMINGEDELAALANGLNNMRLSFRALLEKEAEVFKENSQIITEISHDLRTPVTSILLYTEILQKEQFKNREQSLVFLEKIKNKTYQMKTLTDNLLKYALVSGSIKIELEPPQTFQVLFYDLISETCNYLSQEGFEVVQYIEWKKCKISIKTEFLVRIFDNIATNIIKYADKQEKIIISSIYDDSNAGFVFENKEKKMELADYGFGVGLHSVSNMMKKMNGDCRIFREDQRFRLEIRFPVKKV